MTLTQERLKKLLHYDPHSGIFRWRLDKTVAGYQRRDSDHLDINIDGNLVTAHRLAVLYMTGQLLHGTRIKHIDKDKANNRWKNIEIKPENPLPSSKLPTTDDLPKTITYDFKRHKWEVRIEVDGKEICIGHFNTSAVAKTAYYIALDERHKLSKKQAPMGSGACFKET